jgi:hypothetical protein
MIQSKKKKEQELISSAKAATKPLVEAAYQIILPQRLF